MEEYRALPPWRRTLERTYRTTPGVAIYAIAEIWWTHMIRLTDNDRRSLNPVIQRADRCLVATYAMTIVGTTAWFGPSAVIFAVVLPWLMFNWLFGIVILQHHTHPRSRWFRNREEWSFYNGQVVNTVHVIFPKVVELLLHNITVHGAHHVDPKIPLYRLPMVQDRLEHAFGNEMITERWTLASHQRLMRSCKLYDYDRHRWLDFNGAPTTNAGAPVHRTS